MGRPGVTTGTHKKPKLGPSDAAYPRFLPTHHTTNLTTNPPQSEGHRTQNAPEGGRSLQHARHPARVDPAGGKTPAPNRPPPRDRGPDHERRSNSRSDAPIRLPPTMRGRFEPPERRKRTRFETPADQWNAFGAQNHGIRLPGAPLDATRRLQNPGHSPKKPKNDTSKAGATTAATGGRWSESNLSVGQYRPPKHNHDHTTAENAGHRGQTNPGSHTRNHATAANAPHARTAHTRNHYAPAANTPHALTVPAR